MKTSKNLLLWTTHATPDLYPLLARLKAAGYDGVEVPVFEGDEAHFKKLRQELSNQGLGCTSVTVLTAETNAVSPDAGIRKAALERLKWAIHMSAALGSEVLCGPYHSALGVFSGAGPTEDEKKRAADALRQAADEAQKVKLRLAIEYLNRFECYVLTTAADAKDMVKRVGHSNFKAMYDTFHAHIEEKDPAKAIGLLGSDLIHVHISENDRGTPGTGHVHWKETFQALKQAKYDNWLVIEAFGRSLPALAAATKVWRDLFPSPEEVYTQGLRFMKQMWG
jgi:D-psicose/D-tagatose/L-ribulose 3-epimerase